jgi:S-DNA-T family DNA segregation ATPase FtsK/SpoIIIE
MANNNEKQSYKKEAIAIAIFALAALLAFIIYKQGEAGIVGGFVFRLLASLFGKQGSYVIVLSLVVTGFANLFTKTKLTISKYISLIAFILAVLSFIHIYVITNASLVDAYKLGLEGVGGGLIGGSITSFLFKAFGLVGMYILLIAIAIVSFLIFTSVSIVTVIQTIINRVIEFFKSTTKALKQRQQTKNTSNIKEKKKSIPRELVIESPKYSYNKESSKDNNILDKEEKSDKKIEEEKLNNSLNANTDDDTDELTELEQKKIEDLEKDLEDSNAEEDLDNDDLHLTVPDKEYDLPSINLLNNPDDKSLDSQQFLRQQAHKIEETLSNFKIDARVTKVSVGPTITRFELQIAAGIKVSKVSSLENDIALSLAVKSIRIEAPIPGKSAIGIEVPNETTNIVLLKEVLTSEDFENTKDGIKIGLGLDISGAPVVGKINELPHMLIAGATGSGKSVCINVIINSILLTKKPHQVKFVLIDPKRVELSVYDELPHLLTPVVTDPRKASQALMWVVQEMEKRYQLLAKKGVRNITQYNKKIKTSKDEDKELPFVVIVIDELADLMMVASKDVEDSICRIAQMGRAAGIHLVIGTQRPSVDVITGLIKANIPARIAFAVSSSVDSRTILDMSGAERLLGNGDMLYMPPGLNKPIRVQGSYISESEINKISQFIKDQKDANYAKENFNKSSDTVTSVLEDRDELFEEALLEFIDYGSASISLLQRRFRIGYTRAARIVDQLEEAGAISGYAGSKPRDVLMESKIVKELINNNDK